MVDVVLWRARAKRRPSCSGAPTETRLCLKFVLSLVSRWSYKLQEKTDTLVIREMVKPITREKLEKLVGK